MYWNKLHTLILKKRQLHCKGTTHYLFFFKCSDDNADIILIIRREKKPFQVIFFHTKIFQTSLQINCFSLLKRLHAEVWEELYSWRKAGMRITMLTITSVLYCHQSLKRLSATFKCFTFSPSPLTEQIS